MILQLNNLIEYKSSRIFPNFFWIFSPSVVRNGSTDGNLCTYFYRNIFLFSGKNKFRLEIFYRIFFNALKKQKFNWTKLWKGVKFLTGFNQSTPTFCFKNIFFYRQVQIVQFVCKNLIICSNKGY